MQELRDANLRLTLGLPNGATTATSTGFDTNTLGAQVEFLLSAPALSTAEQPDGKTLKYDICYSDNADLSSPTTYIAAAITQIGAGGAGAAAATFRFRLPSAGGRYLFFKATGSASGNASAESAMVEALF